MLRRARHRDDRRVDDRARLHEEALRRQQFADGGKELLRQPMRFQEVAKPQDRRLVEDHVLAQLDACKPPHRLAVVDGVFGLGIRQIERLERR
jgi:hypothetical protein